MIKTEQYCKLTSVIKLWIADCKCNKMKTMLLRMLYYLHYDQIDVEKTMASLINIRNSFIPEVSDCKSCGVNICLENKSDTKNKSNNQNINNDISKIYSSCPQAKQLRKKNINDYPESIRYKIQFFESMSSCINESVNTDKKRSTKISEIVENTPIKEVVVCPPPIVVGMILKQTVCERDVVKEKIEEVETNSEGTQNIEKVETNKESFEKLNLEPINVSRSSTVEDNYFIDKRNSSRNSSILSNKDKGNERFLVNLLEPRTTKKCEKDITVNQSINQFTVIRMNSELYIKPTLKEEKQENSEKEYQKNEICKSARLLNDTILDLLHKVYDQCQIIRQAVKAVETCRRSKTFFNSIQRAEAERILLTATLKRSHYLQRIESEKLQYPTKKIENTADLTISNIKFPFNIEEIDSKNRSWYLVTCVTESKFYISSMLELSIKRSYLQLPEMYTFGKVSPDFKIKLYVYELNSHNTDRKKKKRIHHKLKQKFFHGKHFYNALEDIKTQSAFKNCGWLELTINNLSQNVLTLNKTLDYTPLSVVHLSASAFSSALNLKYSGFITIGVESNDHLVWDKNWCKLLNSILHFWSNPSEEALNNYKQFIDLRNCVITNVRNVCMRSNTLVLENSSEVSGTTRYYLSCDTLEEFDVWKRYINSILDTFKGWKTLMYV